LCRGDEGQAWLANLTFAVQPPQTLSQRQRLCLLQYGSKAAVHAVGALQQARTAPGQLIEIFGWKVQGDQLRIERQLLRCTLQQFEQGLGRAGTAQGLGQIGFAQGAGQ